jgi:hypothetical protein
MLLVESRVLVPTPLDDAAFMTVGRVAEAMSAVRGTTRTKQRILRQPAKDRYCSDLSPGRTPQSRKVFEKDSGLPRKGRIRRSHKAREKRRWVRVAMTNGLELWHTLSCPDATTQRWISVVERFMASSWSGSVACPFCASGDLHLRDIRAGTQADLRRWIFCDECAERISMPCAPSFSRRFPPH